ncbi:hypothetical protein ASA1KI_31450 [Opitutales bacterium ASA1]|uniref:hypothetical protein n=1 Tax=Congregicoccus parvus TaxID=3081749 RepID=UPI002B3077AA|nr:hypothetical protein ASA1KI_31450 [Opitutales bacterium ASA1]
MKKTRLGKHDEDYLVLDILTVPTELSSDLPVRHRDWLARSTRSLQSAGVQLTQDEHAAVHPLYGTIVGFAAAKVRLVDSGTFVTHYGLDVGDEASALQYAQETLAKNRGVTVSYHGRGYLPRMLLGRLLTHGIKPQYDVRHLANSHVDLADTVSLHGMFSVPPLALTLETLGVRTDRPRLDLVRAKDACDRGDDETLDEELRARVDDLTQLLARLWASRNSVVHGSLRARQVCAPSTDLRRAG